VWAGRLPYAVLLGVLAFVLEFIPVLGTLTSGAQPTPNSFPAIQYKQAVQTLQRA